MAKSKPISANLRQQLNDRQPIDQAIREMIEIGATFLIADRVEPHVEIELTNGEIAIVSESDAELAMMKRWLRNNRNAIRATTVPEVSLARWITSVSSGTSITHRNGNHLDNSRENLLFPYHHTTLHPDCAEIRMPGMRSAWISLEDVAVVQSRRWIFHPCTDSDLIYAIGRLPGIRDGKLLHNIVMPDAPIVDHVDRDGLNCRRGNMRLSTSSQNSGNTKKKRSSQWLYKGIFKNKLRWSARIVSRGTEYYLGNFKTQEEAARAYDAKARELFGEFARVNFPVGSEQSAI